jgi:hypothetical protein
LAQKLFKILSHWKGLQKGLLEQELEQVELYQQVLESQQGQGQDLRLEQSHQRGLYLQREQVLELERLHCLPRIEAGFAIG